MPGCTTLYILKDKNAPHIKIGVAGADVLARADSLPEDIDNRRSFYVECGKSPDRLEKTLHMMFEEHRVAKPPGDGYTEWFADEIREEVLAFLIANARRLSISAPLSLPSPKPERVVGKRSNPAFEPTTIFLRKATKRTVYRALEDSGDMRDLSELTDSLLQMWISERA